MLTPEDHDFFLRNGYLILKRVVPPELIAPAVAFLEGAAYEGEVSGSDDCPLSHEDLKACLTKDVFRAVGEIFGEEYPFPHDQNASDMPRPHTPDLPWESQRVHVDDDYPTLMPAGWALGLFLFLTPVKSKGGAFRYAPGSPIRYREAGINGPEALSDLASRPPLSGEVLELLAEPGDVLLFHHLMGHSGTNNVSDPQTRHALLHRFHPYRRIVPGTKPPAQMTTIEKVNSARCLHSLGLVPPKTGLIFDAGTQTVLEKGIDLGESVTAYSLFRFGEEMCIVTSDRTLPGELRVWKSRNLADWTVSTRHPFSGQTFENAPVTSLHRFEREPGLTLFAGFGSGGSAIWSAGESTAEKRVLPLPHLASASPHYTTGFGSKTALGNVLISVNPEAPHQVCACWGKTWEEAEASGQTEIIAAMPPGTKIKEVFVKPILGESEFALVLEVELVAESDETSTETGIYVSRSSDGVRYEAPPRPLGISGAETAFSPRQIRVAARARSCWLVTYRAEGRLLWGEVDWEHTPVVLNPIRTPEALERAFGVVGWL